MPEGNDDKPAWPHHGWTSDQVDVLAQLFCRARNGLMDDEPSPCEDKEPCHACRNYARKAFGMEPEE